jgi:cytochrome c peroxidase
VLPTPGCARSLMMLPSDMALVEDPAMLAHVKRYASSPEAFAKDFAAAFSKLLELGVQFPAGATVHTFPRAS